MSIWGDGDGGHYDEDGRWVRNKFCFVYCGPDRCTCQPPSGQDYSPVHDQSLKATEKNAEGER